MGVTESPATRHDPRTLAWVQMVPGRAAEPITQQAGRGLVTVTVEPDGALRRIEIADGWEDRIAGERLVGLINAALAAAHARRAGQPQLLPPNDPDAARFETELAAAAMEARFAPGLDLHLLARRYRDDPPAAAEAFNAALDRIDAGLAAASRASDQEPDVVMNPRRTFGFVLMDGVPVALQADPRWPSGTGGRLSRELNEFLSQIQTGRESDG